jgi:hypothetical protein
MTPVRRAARKAASPVVTIEGERVHARSPEGAEAGMSVAEFSEKLLSGLPDSCGIVWPDGTTSLEPTGSGFVLVHQTPPAIHGFRWIAADSESEYGPETSYREVRLALPFLVVLAVFEREGRTGRIQLGSRNECFFTSRPLAREGMDTPLCFPALLNCSRFPDEPAHPLSWICTQHLPASEYARRDSLSGAVHDGLKALLRHLLESGFNRSSEHHELSSWFTETVKAEVDPRLASVEAWEAASSEDPLFVLEVPWLPTGRTLGQVIERIRSQRGGRRIRTAQDVARVVLNSRSPVRRKA